VIDKVTGKEIDVKYTADSCLTLHHVNAYEDSGHIVVDVCAYDDDTALRQLSLDCMAKPPTDPDYQPPAQSRFTRFVLPLPDNKKVRTTTC
jgi:carotenoid isomerooxygenase